MGGRFGRMVESLWREWHEAPWFVLLVVVMVALIGPGLLYALWESLRGLF